MISIERYFENVLPGNFTVMQIHILTRDHFNMQAFPKIPYGGDRSNRLDGIYIVFWKRNLRWYLVYPKK